jgi:deazaflavin-dependent oxidoreductase (nitroreductase family)
VGEGVVLMFERMGGEDFAYLTTTGRVSGKRHTIEIWFALRDGVIYMLSGGGDRSHWVRNIRKDGDVHIRIGSQRVRARARIVRGGTKEDRLARELLDAKYMGWREGARLSSWARGALPVAVEPL